METSRLSISVITPIHRGTSLIKSSVAKIHEFLSKNFSDFEIILIDSQIGEAPALCDLMAATYSSTRVIHDSINTQFGSKVKIGYHEAKKDLIWLITLDLPFSLEYGLEVIPLLQNNDCVFSYRTHDTRSPWRRFQSSIYNFLMRRILNLKVRSVNSQFRIFKRSVVKPLKLLSEGWFIDAEVLYHITKRKIPYTEIAVPLIMDHGEKSSVSTFAFLDILVEMFYFIKNRDRAIS